MFDHNQQYKIVMQEQPVSEIKAIRFSDAFIEVLAPVFKSHGIAFTVSEHSLTLSLPNGTTRVENLPRIHFERYTVTLPDGFRFSADATHGELFNIGIEADSLPPEVQQQCTQLLKAEGRDR